MGDTKVSLNCAGGARRSYAKYRRRPYRSYKRTYGYRKKRSVRKSSGKITPAVLPKFVLAQLTPFAEEVKGVKIPDSNTYPSTPLASEDEFSMVTTATSTLSVAAFTPYLPAAFVVPGTYVSGSSWSWAASFGGTTASARTTSIANNYELVRPVAHGVRLYCPLAPTSTTGFVHVCIYAPSDLAASTWALPTTITQMNNCPWYKRYPLAMLTQKPVIVSNKFLDCTATRYTDPADPNYTQTVNGYGANPGWAVIIVAVDGQPAVVSTPVVAETITHYEATPLMTGVNSSSAAANFNPSVLQATSVVTGHVDTVYTDTDQPNVLQAAAQAVQRGVNQGLSQLNPYLEEGARQVATGLGRWAWHQLASGRRGGAGGLPGVTNNRLISAF